MNRRSIAHRLLRLLRPLSGLMVVSSGARIVNQALGVAIPAIAGAMLVDLGDDGSLWAFAGILIALAVVKGGFRYIEQFTGHAVAFRLLAELRVDTYRAIVPLAPAGLDADRTGDLVSRIIGDIDRVEPFYAHTIAPLASGIVVPLLAAAGLAVWVDPLVALAFLPFPLLMVTVVPFLQARRVEALATKGRAVAGETAALFTDSVQGAREIEVFRAQRSVMGRIRSIERQLSTVRKQADRIGARRIGMADLLAGGAVVAVIVVSAARWDAGSISLSGLVAAIIVAWTATAPARLLADIVPDIDEALSAASRIFELADRPDPLPPSGTAELRRADASLIADSVAFTFPNSVEPTLEDVSFAVPTGGYAAIVGPSGSGKSTVMELLLRLRDPDSGSVAVGGQDVRSVAPDILRRSVTLVPQRPDIFYGTVKSNVLLGNPDADDHDVWSALERAQLAEWVRSLPDGLDAMIGEFGETMSGGQRQRLAIARALVSDAPVLLIDEATSELDAATEARVLTEMKAERAERTVLVVAHRLDNVTDADQILVLDRGRVVEAGTHDELLHADGVYAGLWSRHLDVLVEA